MADLIGWHRQWLSSVYAWSGKVRSFNLSKQGFAFVSAHLLTDLLAAIESEQLARLTPFNPESVDELIGGLAQVHVELVLIHPFREWQWANRASAL
jgi:cell filamentation protein